MRVYDHDFGENEEKWTKTRVSVSLQMCLMTEVEKASTLRNITRTSPGRWRETWWWVMVCQEFPRQTVMWLASSYIHLSPFCLAADWWTERAAALLSSLQQCSHMRAHKYKHLTLSKRRGRTAQKVAKVFKDANLMSQWAGLTSDTPQFKKQWIKCI